MDAPYILRTWQSVLNCYKSRPSLSRWNRFSLEFVAGSANTTLVRVQGFAPDGLVYGVTMSGFDDPTMPSDMVAVKFENALLTMESMEHDVPH